MASERASARVESERLIWAMPRIQRKRKNAPQRKPKTIKFNQNEIESEQRKADEAAGGAVGVVVDAEPCSSAVTSVNAVAEDAINQTHVTNDLNGVADKGDNLPLEVEDDIIAVDDEITSKLKLFEFLSRSPHFLCVLVVINFRSIFFWLELPPVSRCLPETERIDERHG